MIWPFKKKPIEVPPCPSDLPGIQAYHQETSEMIRANAANIGRTFSRDFERNSKVIDARQREVDKAIDDLAQELGIRGRFE